MSTFLSQFPHIFAFAYMMLQAIISFIYKQKVHPQGWHVLRSIEINDNIFYICISYFDILLNNYKNRVTNYLVIKDCAFNMSFKDFYKGYE